MSRRWVVWAAAFGVIVCAFRASAQVNPGTVTISLQPVMNSISSGAGLPADFNQPGDGRLYVGTRDGKILMDNAGTVSTFGNIAASSAVPFTSSFDGGLLGLAFHPNYSTVGAAGYHKIYTYSTDFKTTTQSGGGSISPGSQLTGLPDFWPSEMYDPAIAGRNRYTDWTNPINPNSQSNPDFDHFCVIREWTATADGNSIDTTVAPRVVMRIGMGYDGQASHNGGSMRFGPDGDLYFTVGDGGGNSGQDQQGGITNPDDGHFNGNGNAQVISNIYGKVLRIDPIISHSGGTLSANGMYRIPLGNPFTDGVGEDVDEIFAYGFRNPNGLSFDSPAGTGKLYVADPGQHHREEVDVVQNSLNYGWGYMEGNARLVAEDNQSGDGTTSNGTNVRLPAAGYAHFISVQAAAPLADYKARLQFPTGETHTTEDYLIGDGVGVEGGFVYRGSEIPELNGMYVFGDQQYRVITGFDAGNNPVVARDAGRLFYLDPTLASPRVYELGVFGFGMNAKLLGFGQDSAGELYAMFDNGDVSRIVVQPNWNLDSNGSWSATANWQHGRPDGIDALANFGGRITAPRTITLDVARTVGSISFDSAQGYTISGSATLTLDVSTGTAGISVVSGSDTISAAVVLNDDTTIDVYSKLSNSAPGNVLVFGGSVRGNGHAITKTGGGAAQFENVQAGTLNVAAGTVTIRPRSTPDSPDGTSIVSSLSIGSAAALDLSNNSLIIDYATAGSLVSDVRQHLASGRLTSSSRDSAHRLGYADNAALHKTSFGGQTVDDTSILIKFSYAGDANLDGKVDASDLSNLARHWMQSSGADWTGGDFNYDGQVNLMDLLLLATTWQLGVGSPLAAGSFQQAMDAVSWGAGSVPEPVTPGMVGLATIITCSAKRKRTRRLGMSH